MKRHLCLLLSYIIFFIVFITFSIQFSSSFGNVYATSTQSGESGLIDSEEALFSTCPLAEFGDGWTQEVLRIAQVNKNPIRKCDQDFKPLTVLDKHSQLSIRKDAKGIMCKARSIAFATERKVAYGKWIDLSHHPSRRFTSEFVQTTCTDWNATKVEDFVHMQVVKDEKLDEITEQSPPSVYIFVIDSVSNSQALRSLPKTISLLQKEHDVVNLPHVNKIGENSRPNGLALFFGKLSTTLDRRIFGRDSVPAEWNNTQTCASYLDDQGFVLSEFTKRRGYASLMAEDWASGVFNYPSCRGFREPPVTHYMRPFQVHYERQRKESAKFQGPAQCLETHTFMYQYLDRFIKASRGSPKIAMTWASNVAHDDANGLFHFDAQLLAFFRKHRKEFDRSYVILMGDHGLRFGALSNTWIGRRELNNPMLFVSVPRHLRPNLNPVLKENSKKLLTSYDIHASLVDILYDPSISSMEGPGQKWGSSLFRPLREGERSCRSLPIPLRVCLCEWNVTEVEDKAERVKMGMAATELLNQRLREENISEYCADFHYDGSKRVTHIHGTRGIYSIQFKTMECGAQFMATVRMNYENGALKTQLISDDFTRTNAYGKTAVCMNGRPELRPLCCCT